MAKKRKKKKRTVLPLAPFEQMLRDAGAKRVSKSGTTEFAVWIEETARERANKINKIAMHNKRKTVTDKDVSLARSV